MKYQIDKELVQKCNDVFSIDTHNRFDHMIWVKLNKQIKIELNGIWIRGYYPGLVRL